MTEQSRIATYLLENIEEYAIWALENLEGHRYELAPHQKLILHTLERVLRGEIHNLLISVPPGSSKTSLTVWVFISYLYAINPQAKVLHTSYADALVRSNSGRIKTIIESSEYQQLFPWTKIKSDSNSKNIWETTDDGTFRAVATGSAVTGFRAGRINGNQGIQGLILCDDNNKPSDIGSDVKTETVNDHWENTLKSRKATQHTPVIVIQQRVGQRDFTGYLLENSNEKWHHLYLPVWLDPADEYNQNGILVEHDLPPGSLWLDKWSPEEAKSLMSNIQYSQNPTKEDGDIFRKEFFRLYKVPPEFKSLIITCDTASKVSKYSDHTVFLLCGKSFDNKLYVLDILREKLEVPDILPRFLRFYSSAQTYSRADKGIRLFIEDASSGIGLIQSLKLQHIYPTPVRRTEGKYSRALEAINSISEKMVLFPEGHYLTKVAINELVSFTGNDSHSFDDLTDCVIDAVNFGLPSLSAGASFRITNL